jgi:hypothetical protein
VSPPFTLFSPERSGAFMAKLSCFWGVLFSIMTAIGLVMSCTSEELEVKSEERKWKSKSQRVYGKIQKNSRRLNRSSAINTIATRYCLACLPDSSSTSILMNSASLGLLAETKKSKQFTFNFKLYSASRMNAAPCFDATQAFNFL